MTTDGRRMHIHMSRVGQTRPETGERMLGLGFNGKIKVFIDAGHGECSGVRAGELGEFIEGGFTRQIATRIEEILRFDNMESWMLPRCNNPTLRERHDAAKDSDFAVSIHANSNPDPSIGGMMVFAKEGGPMSKLVGDDIMARCHPALRRHGKYSGQEHQKVTIAKPDGWTKRAYSVLRGYKCPSILVECGFATNEHDLMFMESDKGRLAIALSIVSGLLRVGE